jgi:hypothetical protein
MKWGLILARHDVTLRTSIGIERQRELVNHNLTSSISHNFIISNIIILSNFVNFN